jgi:threonine dehydratase
MGLVTVDDVRVARDVLKDVVQYTPLAHSRVLEHRVGGPVYFKCENLQRAGSFKIRGAYLRISRLTAAERARGVVAASAGNHAQGVALAASLLGAKSTVFMPKGAPLPKVEATKAYGAEIETYGESVDEALQAAQQYAEERGAVLIHPFNHPDVVAGQGTVGLEILEQCPDVQTILVGAGGGGLVSGISVVVKALAPQVRVVAVQAEGAAAFPGSLAAGHPVALESMSTMADGIAIGRPGEVTFAHVQALVDDVVTVSEESLSRALLLCLERSKLVVEPAGVASVAALMDEPRRYVGPVVAVLSGGNIDPLLLAKVIQHGLISAGRFLSFRLSIPDRPGELARLLVELAGQGANVLSVEHSRTGSQLRLGEVEIGLSVETKGEAHSRAVLEALRTAGRVLVFN